MLASESFGDPGGTYGIAELSVQGTVFGAPVSRSAMVTSISVVPEQAALVDTVLVTVSVPPGVSTHTIQLSGRMHIEVRAQSTGFFGTITGAATAVVTAPNGVAIGFPRQASGAPLLPDTILRGLDTRSTYNGPVEVLQGYRLVPGCAQIGGVLYPNSSGTPLGGQLDVTMASDSLIDGFATMFAGFRGVDPMGCGTFLPTLGEVLISGPAPAVSATLQNGAAQLQVPIPNNPSLDGAVVNLQCASIGANGGFDMSSGLRAELNR